MFIVWEEQGRCVLTTLRTTPKILRAREPDIAPSSTLLLHLLLPPSADRECMGEEDRRGWFFNNYFRRSLVIWFVSLLRCLCLIASLLLGRSVMIRYLVLLLTHILGCVVVSELQPPGWFDIWTFFALECENVRCHRGESSEEKNPACFYLYVMGMTCAQVFPS
ncbi:hypothetical protein CDAR_92021 [Caerostris darwini]|uniref:Uncharacterized protein n=1 Tax=Caerostris darwini TaxID=1538125 RepID=A0AAV4QQN7_9ARAC|nr:hypothetical protein CDAR_92021 [Caerostris darwini]